MAQMAPVETVAAVREQGAVHPRAALAVAMLGFFVVALDAQIVNIALPDIRDSLGGGLSGLQWVVTGYTLMFSALQLFAGTFSDRVGRARPTASGWCCSFSPRRGAASRNRCRCWSWRGSCRASVRQ